MGGSYGRAARKRAEGDGAGESDHHFWPGWSGVSYRTVHTHLRARCALRAAVRSCSPRMDFRQYFASSIRVPECDPIPWCVKVAAPKGENVQLAHDIANPSHRSMDAGLRRYGSQ